MSEMHNVEGIEYHEWNDPALHPYGDYPLEPPQHGINPIDFATQHEYQSALAVDREWQAQQLRNRLESQLYPVEPESDRHEFSEPELYNTPEIGPITQEEQSIVDKEAVKFWYERLYGEIYALDNNGNIDARNTSEAVENPAYYKFKLRNLTKAFEKAYGKPYTPDSQDWISIPDSADESTPSDFEIMKCMYKHAFHRPYGLDDRGRIDVSEPPSKGDDVMRLMFQRTYERITGKQFVPYKNGVLPYIDDESGKSSSEVK